MEKIFDTSWRPIYSVIIYGNKGVDKLTFGGFFFTIKALTYGCFRL